MPRRTGFFVKQYLHEAAPETVAEIQELAARTLVPTPTRPRVNKMQSKRLRSHTNDCPKTVLLDPCLRCSLPYSVL